jgi:Chaperonin GroEL (HSP60 family)
METIKSKSAAKVVIPKSNYLEKKILDTMSTISKIVGGTLGPGGHPVLIERQEYNLPPLVTKDGVTVFRSLGFQDAIEHSILEAARDASVRTAQEAGDGTTTAAILSEAFVRYTTEFCKANPKVPPIQVIKTIQKLYKEIIVPTIEKFTIPCDFSTPKGKEHLRSVAKISGNGDAELADAVMQCFEIAGDAGNVTITESSGKSSLEVEKIEGYPIPSGFEESCSKYYSAFINEPATQRVVLEKPIFLLYFGRLNDFQTCLDIVERLNEGFTGGYLDAHNVVLMATGFSEAVLVNLASIFVNASNINVFPLVIPKTAILNSERHFLDDIAAVTGAVVFDPITKPLNGAVFEDLGNLVKEEQMVGGKPIDCYVSMGVKSFECGRYRSTVIGHCDEEILLKQVENVEKAIPNAESELDTRYLQERLAKLSGGIAKLRVIGSSGGELKERRDRAEDAVCAVRGAIKHGAVIGGGWTIVKTIMEIKNAELDATSTKVVDQIVEPSLLSPLLVLFSNAGIEAADGLDPIYKSAKTGKPEKAKVIDLSTGETVNALEAGILDSVPALQEAVMNSISIATLLGTLGGVVVYPRDHTAEIKEARDVNEFNRMAQSNMADERP